MDELGDGDGPSVWFITVDPERDTPETLHDYLAFDRRIRGLSGPPEDVRAVIDGMRVYAARRPLPDSALGYTMDHSSLFYVFDEAGAPLYALPDSLPPAELAKVFGRISG